MRPEKYKEKTQLGSTRNATDKIVLKGKIRLLFHFYLFLLNLEQNMMTHRYSINVGRNREMIDKHSANIDP